MPDNSLTRGTVVYDGTCGVCQTFVDYFKKRSVGDELEFVAYQLADLNSISPGLTEKMTDKAMYFIRKDGTRFEGAQGVYEVLKRLPGFWRILGTAMAVPLLHFLSERFYQALASNRQYVSKKIGLRESSITTRNETPKSR